jgi:hypothetical protein
MECNAMEDIEDTEDVQVPDLEAFIASLSEVRDFCWDEEGAFDCAHAIPALHMLNMVEPVLRKLIAGDYSDIWADVVDELRWIAAYALSSGRCEGTDAQLVFEAIQSVAEPRPTTFSCDDEFAKLPVVGLVN